VKHLIRIAAATLFSVSMCMANANAQQITIDLGKLDSKLAARVIEAQQNIKKAEEKIAVPKVTVSQAKEWADVGQNLATAVGATAKALSVEVNDFVKTPVGWWAFAFIFWYFLGANIWAIVGGTITWIALGSVIWHSFRIFHIPQRKLVFEGEGKVKKYDYVKYAFASNDARTLSAIAHTVMFVVLSIVMLVIIF